MENELEVNKLAIILELLFSFPIFYFSFIILFFIFKYIFLFFGFLKKCKIILIFFYYYYIWYNIKYSI